MTAHTDSTECPSPGPRVVFFDVGRTLLVENPSFVHVVQDVLASEGVVRTYQEIDALVPAADEYYEKRYCEDSSFWNNETETAEVWTEMYGRMLDRLDFRGDRARVARSIYEEFGRPERWRCYEDVEPAFARLRERGIRIGLISNWGDGLGMLIDGLGLGHYVDAVVASAEVGIHKPDRRIFEYALAALDVEPHDAVHVGDHVGADVGGAQGVGMRAILIDRMGHETPDYRPFLRTLDDLDEFLEGSES